MNTKQIKPKRNKRWRLIADFKIQGLLCARVVIYWATCQFAMTITMLGFACLFDGTEESSIGSVWNLLIPALIVSSLVLPIMLFDLLVFSNRFAGPLFSFRRKMKQLAEHGASDEMRFRRGDFFPELRDHFNKIREKCISSGQHEEERETELV